MDDPLQELANDLPVAQQLEFLKACRDAGLGRDDIDFAKLLKVLQLHKAYYEKIPAQIVAAHRDILKETKAVRDETKALADQTATAAAGIARQCAAVTKALDGLDSQAIADRIQVRLDREVYDGILKGLRGITEAGTTAARSVHLWQRASLAGIWFSALILTGILWGAVAAWFYYHRP